MIIYKYIYICLHFSKFTDHWQASYNFNFKKCMQVGDDAMMENLTKQPSYRLMRNSSPIGAKFKGISSEHYILSYTYISYLIIVT